MRRLTVHAARPLKLVHLTFVALWFGGLAAWLPLVFRIRPGTPDALATYLNLRAIAFNVVGWGGIGSFFSGLAIGGLTTWGLFKRRWTVAKLGLTAAGILNGMFYCERHMLAGLAMLERDPSAGEAFRANHAALELGLVAQMALFFSIVAVAIFKPGPKPSMSAEP